MRLFFYGGGSGNIGSKNEEKKGPSGPSEKKTLIVKQALNVVSINVMSFVEKSLFAGS